jgi:hypothetical protein
LTAEMTEEPFDAPPALEALEGAVVMHIPGSPSLRLTPDAATQLSRDLQRAAADASWQSMQKDLAPD